MEILKNKITAFEAIKQDLRKEIIPTLTIMVDSLTSLVNSKKIDSFTFRSNTENTEFNGNKRFVHVSVSYKEISVVLGIMDNNEYIKYLKDTELSNKKNFPSSLKKSLKELNSNLFFLNQNFPYDMPLLKSSSYYSFALSNLKQINLFPEEQIALFPDFYLENTSAFNNKNSKKTIKKP